MQSRYDGRNVNAFRLFFRPRPGGPAAALAVVGCAIGLCAAGGGLQPPGAAARRPNVVLVTLDTTRADRMGFLGSTRGLTPALDALARESIVFTRAFSQAPITPVSHATILTGLYPTAHRVTDFGLPLPATATYLPDLLRHGGYRTAAFVGALVLDPRGGVAPGFDRGFDLFDAGFRVKRPADDRYQTVERRGDEVMRRALAWLDRAPPPFFGWVHLYDPHEPYDPPADLRARFAASPYDGEIASVDRIVGRLVAALRTNGQLDSTVLAIAGDHGEALGDHGEQTHGVFLYDATLHVPLLLRLPGTSGAGTRVTTRVRLVDVAPTVLRAAGIAVPAAMQGESLLPLVATPKADDRSVYAETEYPRRAFGWSPLASWRADRFLFVRAPRRELYDVVANPAATTNLAGTRARVADAIDKELESFIRRTSGGSDARGETIDPDVAERLAALGYVGGGGTAGAPARGIDPKDRIAVANTLQTAVLAVENGEFAKATPLLERVVATEPGIPLAQLQLGVARARQREYARAIAPLRTAVALQPDMTIAHYELGVALYETGDLQHAAREFQVVAARTPKWADARYSLGSVYARIDRVADAVSQLRAALDLEPHHYRANLLLGRILTLQGQSAAAVPYLQEASRAQPESAEPHQFLGDALEKVGDAAGAAKERQRAQALALKRR
jgi:arylsulfatase A-like enzyme/Flp pilus assembly protein TadD